MASRLKSRGALFDRGSRAVAQWNETLGDSKMKHFVASALVFAIASMALVAPASAGACREDVAAFRQTLPLNQKGAPVDVGSAPQSVGAQLGHQPTPESIARAEQSAQSEVAKVLARADAFDAAGDQSACRDALAKAKLLVGP
jgi:hypothetical protein